MKLYLHIERQDNDVGGFETFQLDNNDMSEIVISEYDYIYFELLTSYQLDLINTKFLLGNTALNLSERYIKIGESYHYSLDEYQIGALLGETHYSKKFNVVSESGVRFSRLFINELGYCSPQVLSDDSIVSFKKIKINSPKINDENFKFIVDYLVFNDYFDEKIIYKNTLDSDNNSITNSFLESIKKILSETNYIIENLYLFKLFPISKSVSNYRVSNFDNLSIVDNNSIDWLFDNLAEIKRSDVISRKSVMISERKFEINNILHPIHNNSNDTYENKVIYGFVTNLMIIIKYKKSEFYEIEGLRNRSFNSFEDFLVHNLHEVIINLLNATEKNLLKILKFFKELGVTSSIYEFPKKTESFLSKHHYEKIFNLMILCQNLFSSNIDHQNELKLEIESFDKLYEVFCFYFLKDSISSFFNFKVNSVFSKALNHNNKLCGKYSYISRDISISIFYENLPKDILQLTQSNEKYNENPDFVIEIQKEHKKYFIIIDAKYKKYDGSQVFQEEIMKLTFKYLHKIGTPRNTNCEIIGLYVLSLADDNKIKTIFKSDFDIFGSQPVFPQIGRITNNPKKIEIGKNDITTLLSKTLEII